MRFIRCPKCGSIPSQTIITTTGDTLYHCMRPIRHLGVDREKGQIVFRPIPNFCDTVINSLGQVVKGWISYATIGIDGLTNYKIKLKVETENIK